MVRLPQHPGLCPLGQPGAGVCSGLSEFAVLDPEFTGPHLMSLSNRERHPVDEGFGKDPRCQQSNQPRTDTVSGLDKVGLPGPTKNR